MCKQETAENVPAQAAAEKGLELLYDYTKFHIGVYLTLTGVYITLATSSASWIPKIQKGWAFAAVACFFLAGLGGGMVGSNIPDHYGRSAAAYMDETLVMFRVKAKVRTWVRIEHLSFWFGIIAAILSFGVPALFDHSADTRGPGLWWFGRA